MPRLWVLLLVIWYRAFTITKTEAARENYGSIAYVPNSKDANKNEQYTLQEKSIADNEGHRNKRSYDVQNNERNPTENPKENTIASGKPDSNFKSNEGEENNTHHPLTNDMLQQKIIADTLSRLYQYNFIDPYYEQCLYGLEKRKFNSWGGKRDNVNDDRTIDQSTLDCLNFLYNDDNQQIYKPYDDNNMNDYADGYDRIKMSFHSWGGKRSEDQVAPKRLPFRAWGGKRENTNEVITPKRLPFKAWGGKRSPEEVVYPVYSVLDDPRIDRIAMLSLIQNSASQNEKRVNKKKTKFHSWGGKRNLDDNNLVLLQDTPNDVAIIKDINGIGRRLKFNSWGGKRDALEGNEEFSDDKRSFHSWGGKRNSEELKFGDPIYDIYKKTFHSWGGKRGSDNFPMELK